MIRIHPILTGLSHVLTKQRSGGSWVAYLEGLAHCAFSDGGTEQSAIDNLARAVAENKAAVRESARILGIRDSRSQIAESTESEVAA